VLGAGYCSFCCELITYENGCDTTNADIMYIYIILFERKKREEKMVIKLP
jgi:hypothetical protein